MADPHRIEQAARAARERVSLRWDDARVEALLSRTKARGRRRTVYRVALASAAMIALAAGLSALWPGGDAREPIARPAEAPREDRVLHLADGSTVTLLGADAEVVVMRVSEEEIQLRLDRGAARFDVVPGLPREFRVEAGEVSVAVVGTVFEVRREGDGAHVRVLEGRVRVGWPIDREALLSAGEAARFPRPDQEASAPRAAHRAPEPARSEPARSEPVPVVAPDEAQPVRTARRAPRRAERQDAWMALAESGEYEEAARLLEADDRAIESASLDVLLLASDTMRLTGQPDRALDYLDRAAVLAESDARAPLVAFTRGRLLLTALSRPYDAAEAFARARALAPRGSLAMDALAREVEARAQAGDAVAARARAEEYVARYPNGLRLAAVRRWGGLDP